jgi:hypothetical protein
MEPPLTSLPLTNGTHESPLESSSQFDSSLFRSYLVSLLPPVIGALPEEVESIFEDDFQDTISRFAGEGGGVVYVVKRRNDVEGMDHLFFNRRFNLTRLIQMMAH